MRQKSNFTLLKKADFDDCKPSRAVMRTECSQEVSGFGLRRDTHLFYGCVRYTQIVQSL